MKLIPSAGLLLALSLLASSAGAQNIFPKKIEGCHLSEFCLDCGTPKATYDTASFIGMIRGVNTAFNLKGARGRVGFQVLVDSIGQGCVLSLTDTTGGKFVEMLVGKLNHVRWIPAVEKGKNINSCITVYLTAANDSLSGEIVRVDMDAVNDNMSNPGEPEIYNKTYTYTNPSLKNYEIKVWNTDNSELPGNMSTRSAVDRSGNIWYATYNGFTKFDGEKFLLFDPKNSPFTAKATLQAVAVDSSDHIWAWDDATYEFDGKAWKKYDSATLPVAWPRSMSTSYKGEVFIGDENGLFIRSGNKWKQYTKKELKGLPSNKVSFAYRDKKDRLWIGTYSGSIMIDKNNTVISYDKTETPLKNVCISDAVEDEAGNIYFAVFPYNSNSIRDRDEAGIVKLSAGNKWAFYNDKNSGLPSNTINAILYDRFEKVLWIGTNESGLVRFDLLNGWEMYHNRNSKVPSSYIFQISQDRKGTIYASTFNGLMRIKRK